LPPASRSERANDVKRPALTFTYRRASGIVEGLRADASSGTVSRVPHVPYAVKM
jgi:hypothetical protein